MAVVSQKETLAVVSWQQEQKPFLYCGRAAFFCFSLLTDDCKLPTANFSFDSTAGIEVLRLLTDKI